MSEMEEPGVPAAMDTSNIANDFEELLAAVQGDNDGFIKLIARHTSREDPFEIDEVIAFLQARQLTELWNNLHTKCSAVLMNFSNIDRQDPNSGISEYSSVFQGIVTIALATVSSQEAVPQMLFETAALLHGILLLLPEGCNKLQSSIVSLCETWWNKDIAGREDLISQAITVLIQKVLLPKALKSDVKRLWKMHEAFDVIDWSDSGSDALKLLLMQIPRSQSVMGCEQGRKLLAFFFCLNESMMGELHSTMKSIIPFANSSTLDWIGDVYFIAFKMLVGRDGDKLTKFETSCLQDLMYAGVHASHTVRCGASKPLSFCTHRILSFLHQQKHQNGIDSMLTRLYKPFLWRSLKVANGDVRANAAFLFFDAFPFVDAADDDLSQRQIETIKTLLNDRSHVVRCIAVKGVCNVCTNFWSLLSSDDIKTFVTTLVQKLAWDSSSADVRAAVVKGMEQMVGNNLTHAVLQPVLPNLRDLFHDVTDKVRLCMVSLLIRIKGIKAFKFWSVVPVDHLLARLEVEQSALRNRLVQLLFESFMPLEKSLDTQLDRCIYIWRANPCASRNFYLTCYRHMDLRATCSFILYVLKFVISLVLKEYGNTDESSIQDGETSVQNNINSEAAGSSEQQNSEAADESESDGDHDASVRDERLMAGLFETVALMWMGINSELKKAELETARKCLQSKVSVYLPTFFRTFNSSQVLSPLYMISSFIPPSELVTVSCSLMSKLRSFSAGSCPSDFGCMLEMMCQWKKGGDVLELIYSWLQPCLMPEPANNRRAGPVVRFADPVVSNPHMALRFLEFLMHQTSCRIALLENNRSGLHRISNCLRKAQEFMEKRLAVNDPLSDPLTDEVLLMAFQRRLRMDVLLHVEEKTTNELLREVEDVLTWAEVHVISAFKMDSHPSRRVHRLTKPSNCTMTEATLDTDALSQAVSLSQTLSEGSLNSVQDSLSSSAASVNPRTEFAKSIIESLIEFGINLFNIGICDHELTSRFGDISISLLQLGIGITFLPGITHLACAMIHAINTDEAADEGIGHYDSIGRNVLKEILNAFSSKMIAVGTKQQQAERVLSEVKSSLEEAILSYFEQSQDVENNSDGVNCFMESILTTVLHGLQIAIEKESVFEPLTSFKNLPPLPALLLHAVFGKLHVARRFLSQFEISITSSREKSLGSLSCYVHLLYVIICSADVSKFKELNVCTEALAVHLRDFVLPEDTLQDSPLRAQLSASRDLIGQCTAKLNP